MPLGVGLVFYRTCEEASPTQVTGIASGPGAKLSFPQNNPPGSKNLKCD